MSLRKSLLALVLSLAACAVASIAFHGCKTNDAPATTVKEAAAPSAFPAGSACERACADPKDDRNWAVCYSCRCKAAFDDYLPTAAEISCAKGVELKIFKVEGTGTAAHLTQVTTDVSECLNPDRLRQHCTPGSRIVQVKKGDSVFKAICKREVFLADYNNLATPFSETGIIAHNQRTGATCFWDDNDDVISGENQPEIDLTDGAPAKVDKFLANYYRHEGDACTACHDNDAFMYDPHLATSGWITNLAMTTGPYHLVHSDGQITKAGKHLVSDDAEACTSCHRISQGATCDRWALDSMGYTDNPQVQPIMHAAGDGPWGMVTEAGFKWTFPYWMPDHNYMRRGSQPPATKAAWTAKYGKAMETIKKCCADPNAAGCTWDDIPMTAGR